MKIIRPVKRFRTRLCVIRNLQLLVLAAVLITLLPWPAAGREPLEAKRVLILLPSQSDTPAHPLIVAGIQSALAAGSEFHIDYFIEHMDLFRNTSQAHDRKLAELYQQKYAHTSLDLVVPFSGLALDFAIAHGAEIFSGTPVVFSGVFKEELSRLELPANFTGTLADIDFAGQLEMILKIQPETRRVAIVNGASSIELSLETKIRKAFESHANRLDFIYLTRLPLGAVAEKVRNLPDHTVVLFYLFMLGGNGTGHLPSEVAAQLAEAANVPVYGAFDTYMGRGVLGGRMLSYEMLGVQAGDIGLQILRGAQPGNIPLSGHGTHLDLFDWRALKRWQIPEGQLPAGSVVRFKTPSFWDLYHRHVVAGILLFALQSGLVSYLLIQRGRRRRAEVQLRERLAFEELLSALSARFVHLPPEGVDAQITQELKLLGEYLGVDRIRVFELSDTGERLTAVHSFNASGVPPSAPQPEVDQLTWARKKIVTGETVHFADPVDLPAEAEAEKAYLQSLGIKSGVLIPFTTGGTLQGALALTMVSRPREWPQALIRRYGMIAEIIANALARKRSEAALLQSRNFSRRILDSLNFHIAVLDRQGIILDVNESWSKFALENGATSGAQIGGGVNYLAICRRSADSGDALAESALAGIQSVLAGTREHFTLEYPCDSPTAKRWFLMRVIPFSGRKDGVIISHIENTHRKLAEIDLRNAYSEIEKLKTRLEAETAYLQEEIRLEHDFEGIIGQSAAIQYVLYKIEQVAATDASVLVLGETGTGKELICRAIHNNSLRKTRPLIKVDCAALPANLIESELFGHERGAFTGAQARRRGRFEVADGSGLFLDEIGELPLELQGKLLRVLQDGEFERLGSSITMVVDVRVIAATNRDLEAQVRMGRFREDLFYRLNVFPITVPPLRERIADIPLLAQYFMQKAAKKMGKPVEFIPENVQKRLQAYPWPGNVRELKNVIERAVISSSGSKLRLADDLCCHPATSAAEPLKGLQAIETAHIIRVLEKTNWRIDGPKGAAAILELNPSTLRSRMHKLGIKKTQTA